MWPSCTRRHATRFEICPTLPHRGRRPSFRSPLGWRSCRFEVFPQMSWHRRITQEAPLQKPANSTYYGAQQNRVVPIMKRSSWAVLFFVLVVTPLIAQVAEDKRPANLSGTVLRAGSTEPVRGAQLELVPSEVGTLADY